MEHALALARRARGTTSPNPPVGAVLVSTGQIVGEGWTQAAGGPHAEIEALAMAGAEAAGATLYTTLEPCSHWGRTPPCADALIAAGIEIAHIALIDPNPLVNGSGIQKLRNAGIQVQLGEGRVAARDVAEAHFVFIAQRRPFVVVALDAPREVQRALERESDVVLHAGNLDAAPPSVEGGPYVIRTRSDGARSLLTPLVVPREDDPVPASNPFPSELAFNRYDELFLSLAGRGLASVLVVACAEEGARIVSEATVDRMVARAGILPPPGFCQTSAIEGPERYVIFHPTVPE